MSVSIAEPSSGVAIRSVGSGEATRRNLLRSRRPYDGGMPELPEVETIRRRLAPVLEGTTIASAEIVDPRLTRPVDPVLVADALVGERIVFA